MTPENGAASEDDTQNAQDSRGGPTPRGPGPGDLKRVENPYYPAFDLLLARLLAHEEILGLVTHMILSDDEDATESAARGADVDLTADQLSGWLADICEMRQDGFVRHFPTFRVSDATNEARLDVNRAFRRRCCGWIAAQSFESFREFAEEVDRVISEKGQRGARQPECECATIEPTSSRNCGRQDFKSVRRRIRRAAPALVECETRNSRGVNLGSWVTTLSSVRHAIVHSDGIIPAAKWRKLRCGGPKMHFPGREIDDVGYVLEMTPETARNSINRLREYGFAIYKAVSAVDGCHAMLYDPTKGMTVWRR